MKKRILTTIKVWTITNIVLCVCLLCVAVGFTYAITGEYIAARIAERAVNQALVNELVMIMSILYGCFAYTLIVSIVCSVSFYTLYKGENIKKIRILGVVSVLFGCQPFAVFAFRKPEVYCSPVKYKKEPAKKAQAISFLTAWKLTMIFVCIILICWCLVNFVNAADYEIKSAEITGGADPVLLGIYYRDAFLLMGFGIFAFVIVIICGITKRKLIFNKTKAPMKKWAIANFFVGCPFSAYLMCTMQDREYARTSFSLNEPDAIKNGDVIVSVRQLEVEFSVRNRILKAIRKIDLDIYKGETIAIVGESGSGKSVFTKTLTGMLEENGHVSGGEIQYAGVDLAKFKTIEDWEEIRGKRIATIFQDPMTSLNPLLKIGTQITEVIKKHRGFSDEAAKKEAIKLLDRVGIKNPEKRFYDYPFQYSGGMRQRVVIAIALACAPDILICDEPTTALDVTIQAQILALISDLKKEYGFTVIFITHDLGVVAEVADRVAVMYAGQFIEYGNVNDIYYDPRHPYTWSLLSSLPQLGEKGETLYSITGTPPSLFDEVKGDAFAPRNPYALAIDFVKEPPMFQVSKTHYAKTWLCDPRAPKIERPAIIGEITERVRKIYSQGGDK